MLFLVALFALAASAGLLGFISGLAVEVEHQKRLVRAQVPKEDKDSLREVG